MKVSNPQKTRLCTKCGTLEKAARETGHAGLGLYNAQKMLRATRYL